MLRTAVAIHCHREAWLAFGDSIAATVRPACANHMLRSSTSSAQIQAKIKGLGVFHPSTGEVRSDGAEGIATLQAEVNEEAWVKAINHLTDEVMNVFRAV